jgi:hypothetical protein
VAAVLPPSLALQKKVQGGGDAVRLYIGNLDQVRQTTAFLHL